MAGLDLIIRGGTVIDGTGADGVRADIGVAGGRIVEIGCIAPNGARVIEAEGQVVTPGFIDGHTHMDAQMFWDTLGSSSCWHGVTTAVMGNCGFSVAPMRHGQQHLVARNLERAEDISGAAMNAAIAWDWENFTDYLDVIDALPKGINYAAYVGHSALRTWAMGERAFEAPAGAEDLRAMQAELTCALAAGAQGFSTSRSSSHETSDDRPVASRLASRAEVAALVGAMKEHDGAIFELAPEVLPLGAPEGDQFYQWLREVTVASGVATTFGVLGPFWRRQIEEIDATAAAGGRMFGQTHCRGVTTITSFRSALPFDKLPVWDAFRAQALELQAAGLRDPATRSALAEAARHAVYGRAIGTEARPPVWDAYFYYDKPLPPWRTLADIAAERGVEPIEAMIDLALATDLHALFLQFLTHMSDEEMLSVLRHPRSVMTFSDAGAHVSQIADTSLQSYLLAYWCRERELLTLPEAVAMVTGRVAQAWGFADRGVLRAGMMADMNIFDPQIFGPAMPEVAHDLPTGARRLVQKSVGMKATIVRGEVLIEDGRPTGALPGRLIRRGRAPG